jgi:3-hydroxyisobutyrate dehydrogenase
MKTIGLIGAGRMGLPIVGHLARAGFKVLVSERNPARLADIKHHGAVSTDVPALAKESDAILICVGYGNEVEELICSPGGLLETAKKDSIIAVLSTINPGVMQKLADAGKAHGIHIVDSTVCRGSWAADNGTLLSFIGGDEAIVERMRPVLRAYSSDIVRSGGVGTAQVSKAANNLILWACLIANHEALALAKRFDVDIEALRAALLTSSATNGALVDWGKQTMAWADDDMAIVAEMATECGIALPQSGMVRELCRSLKPRRYDLDAYGK